ncbi:MAG: lipid A biosynthesis lauroyl acyltransferase [Proteobacteria bacterium]|nr:MAG: lipid A biosynthesis lauroyl acyltransferase [Pseudomonadota bacterium]
MTQYLHPKYWPSWIGIGTLWLISQLPWRWQMHIGSAAGRLLYASLTRRRQVCMTNLAIAFPEYTEQERQHLCKAHFISLAKGLLDASFSWWGRRDALIALSHIEGIMHLDAALATKRPIIFLSSHFTSLEVSGSIIADRLDSCFVFRPHQNPLLNTISTRQREANFGKTIAKNNIRDMVRTLKQGTAVWYAPDQNFRGKHHLMVPFFGVEAPTNPATSRLAKLSNAIVIPIFCTRSETEQPGYTLHIMPALEDFPGGDAYRDTMRINQIIEQQISAFPEQYLWTHKRYKGCKIDGIDIYQ